MHLGPLHVFSVWSHSRFAAQLLEADAKLRAAFNHQRLQPGTSGGGGCVGIGNYTTIALLVPTARVRSSHTVSSRKLACGGVKSFLNLSAILKGHIFECQRGSLGLCICQGPEQMTLLEVGRVAHLLV